MFHTHRRLRFTSDPWEWCAGLIVSLFGCCGPLPASGPLRRECRPLECLRDPWRHLVRHFFAQDSPTAPWPYKVGQGSAEEVAYGSDGDGGEPLLQSPVVSGCLQALMLLKRELLPKGAGRETSTRAYLTWNGHNALSSPLLIPLRSQLWNHGREGWMLIKCAGKSSKMRLREPVSPASYLDAGPERGSISSCWAVVCRGEDL